MRHGGGRQDARRQGADPTSRGARRGPRGGPAPRRDPAREAAFTALRRVADSDAYANLVLPPLLRERGITGRDAAFATELTYGTLRLRGRYDAIIDLVSTRPVDALDAPVADALRLGAHQLLGMRVPDHAAVSETVALTRSQVGEGPANLVNAVLRRISEHDEAHWLGQLGAPLGPEGLDVAATASATSHPAWIVRTVRQALGSGAAPHEVVEALDANNVPPAVTLALRPGLASDDDLPPDGVEPGRWAGTARVLAAGDPAELDALQAGVIGVQDEGSQLVTLALAAVPVEGPDHTWLDLCAGPGGKSALLGALLAKRDESGVLVANEIAPHRAELVAQSARAVRELLPGLQVQVGDGVEVGGLEPGRYDRVLLDAPCTGLGALRRRPEARWRRTPADLAALGQLQRRLLTSALQAVRPGGVVAYVTCSPHVAETELVVRDVLRRSPGTELLDAAAAVQSVARTELPHLGGPMVQLWPHRHGTDAMFLALIRRNAT